jgi:hypothetical protein
VKILKHIVSTLAVLVWITNASGGNVYTGNGIEIDQMYSGWACADMTEVEPGVYDIEIVCVAYNSSLVLTISAHSSGVKIRNIWIQCCETDDWPTNYVTLIVEEDGGTFDYIESIRQRNCQGSTECGWLEGDNGTLNVSVNSITGHIGHPTNGGVIVCDKVEWLHSTGGNLYADVYADDEITWVHFPSITSGIYGDLVCSDGLIHSVATQGEIGTPTDPITISGIGDTRLISTLTGGIHANISIDGNLRRVRNQGSDWTGTAFVTRIDDTSNPSASGAGFMTEASSEVLVDVRILEDWRTAIQSSGLGSGALFQIGRDLDDSVYLQSVPSPIMPPEAFQFAALDGLKGQIIVNAEMTGGDWNGSVQVNTGLNGSQPLIDLSPASANADQIAPHYTILSHRLGGGAVGLAPFNFHQFTGPLPASRADLDCNPYHTEFLAVGACEEVTGLTHVDIEHYGPVFVRGATDQYRVEFRPAFTGGGATWTDVTGKFVVDTSFTATTEATAHRVVRLVAASGNQANFAAAGWFRFRPIVVDNGGVMEHQVRCAGVNGTPGVAYDSSVVSGDLGDTTSGTQYDWYQFRVGLVPCPPESELFAGDQVNASDLTVWIDSSFEVNMDGQVCSQDFADMSAAYDGQ